MEYGILGSLEVMGDGELLALGGPKQRALLAILVLHANEPVSIDRLIDELWPDQRSATAAHTIQVYVSNLRKVLGAERLVTRAPGYLLVVGPEELDLMRVERLLDESRRALTAGDPARAAASLREALSLWRGPPLADFAYDAFAQAAITRLEELRLVALEERIEADLALGRHAQIVGELQGFVAQHPLRERSRKQLMLALYRSGRQAEALDVFQRTRRLLVEELGIDPSPSLQQLERAILQQDPELELPATPEQLRATPQRSILVAGTDEESLGQLLGFAEHLARSPNPHELIVALALPPHASLPPATAAANDRRRELATRGITARATAFRSMESGTDLVRLASEQHVDLVLLHGPASMRNADFDGDAVAVLATAPCDVALLFDRDEGEGPVLVPFGGAEHDWAALELGAWYAQALGVGLTLLGSAGEVDSAERDASRLLAHAALAVQGLVGVSTDAVLAAPGVRSVLERAEQVCLLVVGLGDDWGEHGLGSTRTALVEGARAPTAVVRRGLRPGGLAPGETLTRFTWSLSGA